MGYLRSPYLTGMNSGFVSKAWVWGLGPSYCKASYQPDEAELCLTFVGSSNSVPTRRADDKSAQNTPKHRSNVGHPARAALNKGPVQNTHRLYKAIQQVCVCMWLLINLQVHVCMYIVSLSIYIYTHAYAHVRMKV